jgi:hypothetical protein
VGSLPRCYNDEPSIVGSVHRWDGIALPAADREDVLFGAVTVTRCGVKVGCF